MGHGRIYFPGFYKHVAPMALEGKTLVVCQGFGTRFILSVTLDTLICPQYW
jgi:hypothetical protein